MLAETGVFEQIAQGFGLDWGKFTAQVIIFLIVFYILQKKAFGPILAMLELRRKRIQEGEENLKKIQQDLAKAEAKAREIADRADKDAERMIEEARESANALRERRTQEATAEANQILAKAREAAELDRDQVMTQLRRDFGRLVVDTTAKVTGKVLTPHDQEVINQETAAQVAL